MWAAELGAAKALTLELKAGRQAYFLQVEGSSGVAGDGVDAALARHDAAELVGPCQLTFTAGAEGAHLLVVEMAGAGEDSRFR